MLGNGIMGAGIITEPVVIFALVVWAGFVFLSVATAVWAFRFVRAYVSTPSFSREELHSFRDAPLKIEIPERRKEIGSKGKLAA